MTVVLDSNVIISAVVFGKRPEALLDLIIDGEIAAYISEEIIKEVNKALVRTFPLSPEEVRQINDVLKSKFALIAVDDIPRVARDPKDDHILAITHEVAVDYIVTGDKDLLVLEEYNGVPIISVAEFLNSN